MLDPLPSFLVQVLDERSQLENAELLGISPQYLCDIQKGRRRISAAVAVRLMRLGITEGYVRQLFLTQANQEFADALLDAAHSSQPALRSGEAVLPRAK